MQPKNRNKASDFTPTPMSEILRGISATNQPGPLDDLPPGVPLGQMWDVVNGKLDAKDVTQDPNIEPELQLAARKAEAGGAETGSADTLAGPAPQTPVSPNDAGKQSQSSKRDTRSFSPVVNTPNTGVKFDRKEDAVLAFFADVEPLTQSDPRYKKVEYGALLLSQDGSHENGPFYFARVHKGITKHVSMRPEYQTIAMMHTHPPEHPRKNPYARSLNTKNKRLTSGDRRTIANLKSAIETDLNRTALIEAYLATPFGDILHFPHNNLGGKGIPVQNAPKFEYLAE